MSVNKIWAVFRCLPLWEPNEKLTDQKNKSSNHHFLFLKPIGSAARMGNVDMVMSLLACDRIDVNKGEPFVGLLEWGILMWSNSFSKAKNKWMSMR
jgi:hypothetical protein